MRKFFAGFVVLLVFALTVTIGSTSSAFATSSNTEVTPESVLKAYLLEIKNQDIEKALQYVIDERDLSVEEYKEIMSYEKLNSYKIVKSEAINDDAYYYVVEASYEGGLVTEVPLEVKKVASEWKVNINSDTLSSDDNKVLQQGSDQYYEKAFSKKQEQDQVMNPLDVLVWWDFEKRQGGKPFYTKKTFSIPNQKTVIVHIGAQLSTTPNKTGITYAVVRKGALGDTMWGQKYVKGHYFDSKGKRVTVKGNSKKFKGASLRFTPNSGGTYSGNGGLDW
ncbi:hypothetical protein [Bacillus atrophaeus]|uniref:hypothetical protein n=1 Tax=Bacillus atrophaeus TaxID=1452 RepID=UPI002DBE32DA|nr:hypothetical protein [Bacillus atrophaeus]MEC1900725.1 hypothetical protein [Bacillus atrophaeus]MEC2396560.1 hypothetical protein [Bacillus atrophaeus]MED4436215.1 hypothetical protein [Bacillus atrophaeus]MED4563821.1 hypothetical protein [Bacillus atrophaeus]MED4575138.1 hypothetical protein [Bacillus atrophaeus]